MDDQHFRTGILDNVAGLFRRIVPVDRYDIGAAQTCPEGRFHESEIVAHVDRDDVAGTDTEAGISARGALGARVHLRLCLDPIANPDPRTHRVPPGPLAVPGYRGCGVGEDGDPAPLVCDISAR